MSHVYPKFCKVLLVQARTLPSGGLDQNRAVKMGELLADMAPLVDSPIVVKSAYDQICLQMASCLQSGWPDFGPASRLNKDVDWRIWSAENIQAFYPKVSNLALILPQESYYKLRRAIEGLKHYEGLKKVSVLETGLISIYEITNGKFKLVVEDLDLLTV